jgi:asparagine synthase (glutamine-hydrolysing)
MHDPASGCVVTFNGEIYNFRDLRAELERAGEAFRTTSDTEVMLRAWSLWGPDAVRRLRGMFAFALWDPRRNQVYLCRDRLGVKPLYYASLPRPGGSHTTLFASEVRALLESPLVERRLDPSATAAYVWNGFVPGHGAIVAGIRSLPPGALLTLTPGQREPTPITYWSLGALPRARVQPDEVESRLKEAIRLRLISDRPLGVFLSGGVDSTAVATVAASALDGPLKTFTVAFEEGRWNESSHARALAERIGAEHTEIVLSRSDFRARLDEALGSLDQPTFDGINTYFVSRAVRDAGITVALAGTGGDELFGGYRSFRDIPRAQQLERWMGLAPSFVRSSAMSLASSFLSTVGGPVPPQTRWGKLPDLLSAKGQLVELYQTNYALYTQELHAELTASLPDVRLRFGLDSERFGELVQLLNGDDVLSSVALLELSMFTGSRLLRDTDSASMAASLEVRVPLLDHLVVEACAAMDPAQRFQPLGEKRILRSFAPASSEAEQQRPKAGFVLPIEVWCRSDLGAEVEAVFHDAEACRSVGLDPQAVARLWKAFKADAPGIYWSRIWSLYVLMRWCRAQRVRLVA